jgi:SOS-response transcriptional repressor LexA
MIIAMTATKVTAISIQVSFFELSNILKGERFKIKLVKFVHRSLILHKKVWYNENMHEVQQKLLKVAQEKNLGQHTLREIGSFIGEKSPQKVKHHLLQLQAKGLIKINKAKGMIEKTKQEWERMSGNGKLLTIPILGAVNAGPAQIFAETNIEGFLRISSSLLAAPKARENRLFALKVVGPSMNKAKIGGNYIEDGDYVVVNVDDKNVKNGDIVLSIIDGMANIKKFFLDKNNNQVVLMSESTKDNFMINGKVVQVIKKPRFF